MNKKAATAKDRKQAERERKRALGLERCKDCWIHPSQREYFLEQLAKLEKRCQKEKK